MSSWFSLSTKTHPPFWRPLNKELSDFIQNQYGNSESPLLQPFYLPQLVKNENHRIRLLPDVVIPMALDCNDNTPLIRISNKKTNMFGFNIEEEKEKEKEQTKEINVDLITQKIIFCNQINKKNSSSSSSHKWYCLGIGDNKNIWYPFNEFINKKLDEYFNDRSSSFTLDEGNPCLNIRFGSNAFNVNIPFGFAVNQHKEEFLIIKYTFDFYGLINGLNVSLHCFNNEGNINMKQKQIKTKNKVSDCIKLCNVLYRIFDDVYDIEMYSITQNVVSSLRLDGVVLSEWMKLEKKAFATKMYKEGILKKGPAQKLWPFLMLNINRKYIYNYNIYDIVDVICSVSIAVHSVIRECIINNKYCIDSIINNDQMFANMVHTLSDSFRMNKKTKHNEWVNKDEQQWMNVIKNELKCIKLSDILMEIIFGDKKEEKEKYRKIENEFLDLNLNKKNLNLRLRECGIYLNEIRQQMISSMNTNDINDIMALYKLVRYREMKRVNKNILSLKYDQEIFESKGILENDKKLEEFLNFEIKIKIDINNKFLLKRIKVRLKNDINNWICCVFFKEYEIKRLKENLRLLILKENITSSKLHSMGVDTFTQIAQNQCGNHLVSIKLSHKLFNHLPNKKNISPKNCEEIYNQTIRFIDKWWNQKKNKLKKRCIQLSIDKQSFFSHWIPNKMMHNKITWNDVERNIVQIITNHDNDINFNLKHLTITIRICCDNDIQSKSSTFGEWLLNILEDKQEFNHKMQKLKQYIIEKEDVNANKLNQQKVKRKDFATNCDECDIPRGVSTKLHKELIKRTAIKQQWTAHNVYNFMKHYLEGVTRNKKMKIIEKIKKEKIGKYEFMQRYAYSAYSSAHSAHSGHDAINKIHDFLRTKMEYTKKEQLLKQMSHRIYLCIGLFNNMYTIPNHQFEANLTKYSQETDKYQSVLDTLNVNDTQKTSRRKPEIHTAYQEKEDKKDNDNYSESPFLKIGIQKDIRQLIPEYIYTMERIREQIDLMKSYVLTNNMDSNIMSDLPKKKLSEIMKSECKIAPGITANLLKKIKAGNQLSPNQMVDFISDHLHEFRNKKLKEIQDSIHKHYPIQNENDFIQQIIKKEEHLKDLLAVKLRKYVKNNTDLYISQILKEIGDRQRKQNIKSQAIKQNEPIKDFVSHLIDIAYCSNKEWNQQQQQIRNHFNRDNINIVNLKRTEFSKTMTLLTNKSYPIAQSGKLHRVLLNTGKRGNALCDDIISAIALFRKNKRDQMRQHCIGANINKKSWSNKKEATEFLTKTVKLKANSRPITNIMTALFGAVDAVGSIGSVAAVAAVTDEYLFAEWLCDVIYSKHQLNKLIESVTQYANKHNLNGSKFTNYSQKKIINDFQNWFNISSNNANNLYQQIEKTPNLNTLSRDKLIEKSCAYLRDLKQIQRKCIIEKCKTINLTVFKQKYAKSIDDLMRFLAEILELKLSADELWLIVHKFAFYFWESYPMDIFNDIDSFILWQSKIICFVKAARTASLLAICLKVNDYDRAKLLSVGNKDFVNITKQFGLVSGPVTSFIRAIKTEIKQGNVEDVILNKISKIVFEINVTNKKYGSLTKKGNDKFIASVSHINMERIVELISNLNQKELNNNEGRNDVLNEMNLCLALFKMKSNNNSDDDDDDDEKRNIDLDLQSLNQMNSRQIAFITCNVIMKNFINQFENLRSLIITKYKHFDGKELYKLCAPNDHGLLMKNVSKLEDVSCEQLAQMACECLESDTRYSHKIKLLMNKINDLNLDGKVLFEKCLVNENSFIEEISSIMKFSQISSQSMKLIWKLMYRNKLDWHRLTTDELMEYANKMCLTNISSIIIDTKLTGKRFVNMSHKEFVNNFMNHPFTCCLGNGSLLQLSKSMTTYSFDSDCKYKDFIENDLGFANSSLSKLIISDFEKKENHSQLSSMNNDELARWISQYPINQLYDILIFHDINNAETLQTQLNSSLLDDVCGFSHFIGGRHSDEMIEKYWIQIASTPKHLLINDLTLVLQLIAFKDNKDNKIQNKYNVVLQNKSLNDIFSFSDNYLCLMFEKWIKMINERNSKFKRKWNEYEIASFLLQQISRHVELSKNTKNTLFRMGMNSNMFSPYEILLALNDFKPFITFLIHNKLNAKQLFDLDKKGELIRKLKDNKKCINDQTGDIYIIWIKDKLLRSEYIDIAKKARQIFSKNERKKRLKLQQIISQQMISFERMTSMEEKEFIDLNIYNERCSKSIYNETFDINKTMNLQIKWFTNYRKDKIYHILYSKKFDWTYFSTINDEVLALFFDKILVLTRKESDSLFTLLHKEYSRRQSSDDDISIGIGLPSIFNKESEMLFYCDGSCHDGRDALNFIETSFGQLILYLKHSPLIQNENISYNAIKQIWYDTMYNNESKLFNHLDIINDNTFDLILLQIIENDKISQIIINALDAFNTSIFIKDLKKYHLKTFITQYQSNNQQLNNKYPQIIIAFLLKIIKNVDHIFEAKYLFYSLLNASCKGYEEYEFDRTNNNNDDMNICIKYFTLEENRNIEKYLSQFDYNRKNNKLSCCSKYYLRLLLSAIIRVSNGIKKNKFSSIDNNNKPKTIYLPITNSPTMRYNLITPTMRYDTSLYHENHENKSYILFRLQSSFSYFGTHFIDLNDDNVIQINNQMFDGYLLCPFIINQMAQTRLKIKDGDKSNHIMQYQCTDINGIYLDKLCPFLTIQQYSNKYFVLFQMYYILGHNKFILLDNKYISSTNIDSHIFIERVEKQMQGELELFLEKKCNLNESEIRKIMISTDRVNEYNGCLSNFVYIDRKTLQSMGISSQSIQNILNVIQQKRNKFFNDIKSILWEEFPNIECIKMEFSHEKIGTFDDDVFYDEKNLEQFIPNTKSRHLLLHSQYVLKAYFKKAYFNFIATKKTLNNLYNNPFDTNHDLKQIFGTLYDTFNNIKQNEMNINIVDDDDDDDDDDNDNNNNNKKHKTEDDDEKENRNRSYTVNTQKCTDFYNELLNGINQLALSESTFFDFIFLPNFDDIWKPNKINKINSLLKSYFKMKYGSAKTYKSFQKHDTLSLNVLNKIIENVESKCFVMIRNNVIGYIFDCDDNKTDNDDILILNCRMDTFSSNLDTMKVYLNEDNKRCAKLNDNIESSLSSTINRFIYSDKQQNVSFDDFINGVEFECCAASIQSRCCFDIKNVNDNKTIKLTDPLNEWKHCDFCVYDIVVLNISNISFSWKKNHKFFEVDDSIYGIVTQIELANDLRQTQYHKMIINKLYELVDSDALKEIIDDAQLDIDIICRKEAFIWNINNVLKFSHSALQIITIEWYTNGGDIICGIYPVFGHISFLKKIENIPRLFDVVVYDNSLFYVYCMKLKKKQNRNNNKPNIELSIIRYNIGNNDDLMKNMMLINYSEQTIKILTPTLHKWQISRHESIWYLPIYLNDFVIRPKTKLPGKITKIFINNDLLNEHIKLPLIYVFVDWLIPSINSQNIFVWTGIGNILLNKQFKYTKDYIIYNELYLVSIECNDRVSRGTDWNDEIFDDQDGGDALGIITKIETNPKGGYEVMVEWDNKQEFNYRFGLSSFFDIDIIQRRSRCIESNIVPIFCGDKVTRSISWKWGDQDSALGFDDDSHIICPQIGVVREIYNNSSALHTQVADDGNDIYHPNKIHHYIYNTPISHHFENDTLIVIDWIDDKYDKNMNQQEILQINPTGLYHHQVRQSEKYRHGYEDSFDVTICAQHTSIPIIPFNKIDNISEFYANYTSNHSINRQNNKDVLHYTYYKTHRQQTNNNDTNDYAQYQQQLFDSKSKLNDWSSFIVNKLNECSKTFITRFVDIEKLEP